MSGRAHILDRFAEALMQPGGPPPAGITAAKAPDLDIRFKVYRNNMFASLIEALASTYPVVAELVGERFFTAMARDYVLAHPPVSPVLLEFGVEFPEFLERFEPVSGLPYLPGTARLEAAWLKAYHAADASFLSAADFTAIAPDHLSELRLAFHPAFQHLSCTWPVKHIWEVHQGDQLPDSIDLSAPGGDLCITRPEFDIFITPLPPGSSVFAEALSSGSPLGQAAEQALSASDAFDLTTALSCFIGRGAFSSIHNPANS